MRRTEAGQAALIWIVASLVWIFDAIMLTHAVTVGVAIVCIVGVLVFSILHHVEKNRARHPRQNRAMGIDRQRIV